MWRKPQTIWQILSHGTEYWKCGKWNNWACVCRSKENKAKTKYNTLPKERYKSKYNQRKYNKNIHMVHNGTSNSNYGESEFHTINNSDSYTKVTTKIKIQAPAREKLPTKLLVKVDTGAEGNILPLKIYEQMYPNTPAKSEKQSNTILMA